MRKLGLIIITAAVCLSVIAGSHYQVKKPVAEHGMIPGTLSIGKNL